MPSREDKNERKAQQRKDSHWSYAKSKADNLSRLGTYFLLAAICVVLGVVTTVTIHGFSWVYALILLIAVAFAIAASALFRSAAVWQDEVDYEHNLHWYNQTSRL